MPGHSRFNVKNFTFTFPLRTEILEVKRNHDLLFYWRNSLETKDSTYWVTDGKDDGIESVIDRIPDKLINHDAGPILEYARRELDVSPAQFSRFSGINEKILRRFETSNQPLSDFLWKGYIRAIQDRHGISRAKACGLLQGLVGEIIRNKDHKRP
jgi:hypothetical protein